MKAAPEIPEYLKPLYARATEVGPNQLRYSSAFPNQTGIQLIERIAAAEERVRVLTEALTLARKHKGVWLHDAECFSMHGEEPCVCGREALCKAIDAALSTPAPEQPAQPSAEKEGK